MEELQSQFLIVGASVFLWTWDILYFIFLRCWAPNSSYSQWELQVLSTTEHQVQRVSHSTYKSWGIWKWMTTLEKWDLYVCSQAIQKIITDLILQIRRIALFISIIVLPLLCILGWCDPSNAHWSKSESWIGLIATGMLAFQASPLEDSIKRITKGQIKWNKYS